MSESRIIVHGRIMLAALILAVVTLPFSVKLCHGAVIVLIANWIAEGRWREKLAIINQSILLQLIILLFFAQFAGLAFSDNLIRGWNALEKHIFFVLIPVALATSANKLSQSHQDFVFAGFIASCLAGTLICVFKAWQESIAVANGVAPPVEFFDFPNTHLADGDSLDWLLFSYVNLARGIDLHPTYFALYISVCILLLLNNLPAHRSLWTKSLTGLLVLYFTVFVILLSSRVVILGLFTIYLFLVVRAISQRRRTVVFLAAGVSAIAVLLAFTNPVTHYRGVEEIYTSSLRVEPDTHYTTATQIRISLWWLAVHSLKKTNPLTGAGTGDVNKAMATTSAYYGITNVISSFDPHNQFLYTTLQNGVPVLVVLLLCLLLPAVWAWGFQDPLVIGFLFLFCLVCLTESALQLQKGIVFYALISGLLFFHRHSFQSISFKARTLLRASHG